jgi:4-hydroxy-tetrahydrodipicolinate synthase
VPKNLFTGIIPAIVTPFTEKGELDLAGMEANVKFYLDSGVTGVVVNGSTGEASALTREERIKTIETAVKVVGRRGKVVAGAGAPTTGHAISYARDAKDAGADAVLVLTPFSVIPTKDGLYSYYREVSKAVDMPVIAYNLPQHTLVNLDVGTLSRLVDGGFVAGIKESSGNMSVFAQITKELGTRISVLTGGDDLMLQSFILGCSGAILALANIAPKLCVELFQSVQKGDIVKAKDLYFKILPVAQAIGSPENFPAPVKEAVKLLGRPAGPCRSPILPVSAQEREAMQNALQAAGLMREA